MIAILFAVVVVLIVVAIPAIGAAIARHVIRNLDRSPASGSIDQSLVEARLGRIEEAIDAMAQQIERLTNQQATLLRADPVTSAQDEPNRLRTEG